MSDRYVLQYSHDKLEQLLVKIDKGYVLNDDEYMFLRALMGQSNIEEDEDEEEDSIDIDSFIKESDLPAMLDNYLKSRTLVTKEDLKEESQNIAVVHNSDMEKLFIEFQDLLDDKIDEVYDTINDYLENFVPGEDNPGIPPIGGDDEDSGDSSNLTERVEVLEEKVENILDNLGAGEDGELPDNSGIIARLEALENAMDKPANYIKPSISISASPTVIEANISTSIRVSPSFNPGDSGGMTSCLVSNGIEELNKTTLDAYSENIKLAHNESFTYTVTVNYSEGNIKQTQMGKDDPNNIKAGSISASATVRGFAPSYHGVFSGNFTEEIIPSLTKQVRTSKGATINFNLSNARCVYMYPASLGNLTSIKDANGFEYMESYTFTQLRYNGVDYNIYVLTEPTSLTLTQTFN
jgi:hypothetical protein